MELNVIPARDVIQIARNCFTQLGLQRDKGIKTTHQDSSRVHPHGLSIIPLILTQIAKVEFWNFNPNAKF